MGAGDEVVGDLGCDEAERTGGLDVVAQLERGPARDSQEAREISRGEPAEPFGDIAAG